MASALRVVTWNCKRAAPHSALWDHLLELDPDIALLQDFGAAVPARVLATYTHELNAAAGADPSAGHYQSAILLKAGTAVDLALPAPSPWVAYELELLAEYFTAKTVTLPSGASMRVISVYAPAYPLDRARMKRVDTSSIRLTYNRDVYATELLWATLKMMPIGEDDLVIVGGDMNSSESFDWGRATPRGNREIIDRMNALGLRDCLREFTGKLTPTFRSPSNRSLVHQLDHLYVTAPLLGALRHCDVGSPERILAPRPMLSDHLPIVADFALP